MKINYTIFAQAPDGDYSVGTNAEALLAGSNYSLFAIDNSGLVSDEISLSVVYVLNNYSLSNWSGNEYSDLVVSKCIVQPMQVPRNVRIIEAYTTHRSMKIEWDPVDNATVYGVYIKDLETGDNWKCDTDKAHYIAAHLRPNNSYEIRVATYIAHGFYSEMSIPVVGHTLLAYFGNIDISATMDSIFLDWEPVLGASYYKIYYGLPGTEIDYSYSLFGYDTTGQASEPVSISHFDVVGILTSSTEFTATGLESGIQYLFYLVAIDDLDRPMTAADVLVRTIALAPDAPDPFTYIIKEITAHSVTIAWSAAARADFYRIHLNNNPEPYIDYIYATEAKIGGLLADTIYTITIVSVNNGGIGAAPPFPVRTARGERAFAPRAPRLIYPNCDLTTAGSTPSFYWQVPGGRVGVRSAEESYDFVLEVADDKDFTQNIRRINSAHSKAGFSYQTAQEAGTKKTVNHRIQVPLVVYGQKREDILE